MINKKMFVKLWLLSFSVVGLWFSFTWAVSLIFRNVADLALGNTETVAVSFRDNWNNFWGAMLLSNWWESATAGQVEIWDSTYTCERQLKWFYYNAERWDRLWPLDEGSLNSIQDKHLSTGASVEWGLYTMCRKDSIDWKSYDAALSECDSEETEDLKTQCRKWVDDLYSVESYYYGMVTWEYEDIKFFLLAWVEYEVQDPRIVIDNGSSFWNTLVSIGWSSPVWFVYDDNWWVGFMHCDPDSWTLRLILNKLDEGKELWKLFTMSWGELVWDAEVGWSEVMMNWMSCGTPWSIGKSMLGLVIEWLVWRSNDKFWTTDALDPKMQYFSSVSVNNATLLNFTKQKADALCRWKRNTLVSANDSVVCISSGNPVVASDYAGKTLIVRGWDVIVSPASAADDEYYDIFIDDWNLRINETVSDFPFVFQKNGFINSSTDRDTFNAKIADNRFPDWCRRLIRTWDDVAVASLLRWNFIVDWNVVSNDDGSPLRNKYFIHGKFTSRDSYDNLLETFQWRCWNDGMGTDGNYCPSCGDNKDNYCFDSEGTPDLRTETCPVKNYYTNSPLVVVDQKFDSPLFR